MAHDLAEYILKSIVGYPESIALSIDERNGKKVLHVKVSQKDMARVMGSRGLVIRAIRTLVLGSAPDYEEIIVEAI